MFFDARNVSFATVEGLATLLDTGTEVIVAGEATKELLHRVTVLERPLERFLFVPGRNNDPLAQIAEALWVMGGRDDIAWLSRYLPRAGDFSDDGLTWRGAYGPRLRRWHGGTDQFDEVRKILATDHSSRRAVMSIFDPEVDYAQSRDIPCNNWLSWIVRDGKLHLAVAIRSNDVVWGFSGANAFEWSVLQEMLAYWLGVGVGRQTWLAGSFHVYQRHWTRAARIVESFPGLSPYDFGVSPAPFRTPWNEFDRTLDAWFKAEATVYSDPDAPLPTGPFESDPFLSACLGAIRVRWGSAAWGHEKLGVELAALPPSDVVAATLQHLAGRSPAVLAAASPPHVRFRAACEAAFETSEIRFKAATKRLHARKDRAYGAAWKRRGEFVSVLPNVARKIDRLEVIRGDGTRLGDEAVLDTALDLYVYVTKYRLLLEERGDPTGLLASDAPTPFSDHDSNFDWMVDADAFDAEGVGLEPAIVTAVDIFDRLWRLAEGHGSLERVTELADELRTASRRVVAAAIAADPVAARDFVADEAARAANEDANIATRGPR